MYPPPHNSDYDKVELVWPGKTTEVERVSLPFQTIERVNEVSRSAAGQARLRDGGELPDWWPEGWRNKLIWGDNKYVLSSLLDEFAGKVDLIYIDPPFATGADFSFKTRLGDKEVEKLPSVIEELAYRDTWKDGMGSYAQMMRDRLLLMRDLLSPRGTLIVHVGVQVNHILRSLCEELFDADNIVDEIIWSYGTPSGGRAAGNKVVKAHEYLLTVAKSYGDHVYNKEWLPYSEKYIEERFAFEDEDGRRYQRRKRDGVVTRQYLDESKGVPLSTVWSDIKQTYAMHLTKRKKEETGYPTQKPEGLLSRVIRDFSNPGDLVADFFLGSGTTVKVAEHLDRRWIGADLGRFAIHTARKRMLGITDCRPFEILNVGGYERSQWQGADVGEQIGEYYDFIVELYGATRIHGFNHLHGIKGDRMIHVGATDAPVTGEELDLAISECAEGSTLALDVLGWEWEMGLNPSRKDELAHFYEVDVHLLNIPREVMDQKAVEAGDIHFFELSVVELEQAQDDRGLVVEITNFLPAVDHYMAEKVGDAISQWSDWIDYWSIDFDYNGETFINSWQSYRTRQDRSLSLTSDPHRYETPGKKTIVVKVIDIFGNDTTRELTVEAD